MSRLELAAVSVTARPLRADAQRNREKLLAAATEAFAEEGEDVALESVAARAGVGIGTLYRHFPSRDALVVAAYQHEVDSLCAAAEDLLGPQPADAALRAWAERFADYVATKRSMGTRCARPCRSSDSSAFAETRERILGALRLLLDAGAADGTLRADVDPEDVMRVINAHLVPPGRSPSGGTPSAGCSTLSLTGCDTARPIARRSLPTDRQRCTVVVQVRSPLRRRRLSGKAEGSLTRALRMSPGGSARCPVPAMSAAAMPAKAVHQSSSRVASTPMAGANSSARRRIVSWSSACQKSRSMASKAGSPRVGHGSMATSPRRSPPSRILTG